MAHDKRVPGPDHPITVEPAPGRVVVRVGGLVLADTTAALTLREADYRPVQYVPLRDADRSLLRRTETSTYCPFKGTAAYYTVAMPDGEELKDAVWTYEEPYPAVAAIGSHLAFYPGRVEIAVDGPV
ncbi:DUF427 domain-containing protein [Nocardiopsis sp. NPDC101807]|uniref:DUF427 domain-containing protein n=1 Tax=Nocardiopsis sp. NPDC101807 TaxID=3364339 RepID=UPI00380758E8